MKKIKKLELKKEIISMLDLRNMRQIKGGADGKRFITCGTLTEVASDCNCNSADCPTTEGPSRQDCNLTEFDCPSNGCPTWY